MKRLSRLIAIMVLMFSLSAVVLAGDMQGPTFVPPPPRPLAVSSPAPGDLSRPDPPAIGSNQDTFSAGLWIELLVAAIF
ncbi:MAG TPA: hypothetical protein VN920_17610 [Pyrinomonadaceae bacterium]|nr:hypothetical protein [Pyrinomonadaceae bacterium]